MSLMDLMLIFAGFLFYKSLTLLVEVVKTLFNYDTGYKKGVKQSFLPFKQANKNLMEKYKEMQNGDLIVQIVLTKR